MYTFKKMCIKAVLVDLFHSYFYVVVIVVVVKPVGLYQSKTGCYTAFDKHFLKGMHHTSGR